MSLLAAAREAGLIGTLPKRSAAHIAAFVAMFDRLCLFVGDSLQGMIETVLLQTGYTDWLKGSDDEDDLERLANIQELVTAATDFDHRHPDENRLEEFLEQVALVNDSDDWESASDRVSLMTLHAAKGLEFPVVYICGAEQGLLPHERTREDPNQIEEERRLLFVGITRAQDELQISYAAHRQVQGTSRLRIASEFLLELPRDDMEVVTPRTVAPTPTPYGRNPEHEMADDPGWSEDVYEVRESAAKPAAPPTLSGMMTAAQMLQGTAAASGQRLPPEIYQVGMVVKHPSHGLGKITAISGHGLRRTATVQFFNATRPAKFMLMHCQLERVESG
jgi:DNA helicase-2/ATP-dependent DNA helicase PcrA